MKLLLPIFLALSILGGGAFPAEKQLSVPERLASDIAADITAEFPTAEERIRAAYQYLIKNVWFGDPVGLDTWRYLPPYSDNAISYLDNRALSPLLFGIGSCEDFAAAMTLLLRAAGFEAQYVAGFTLSKEQVYIDHAWTVVKLGESWYHLDPQLEQNVIRGNRLTYRYYLKSDAEFAVDHKWGENLIEYWPEMPQAEKDAIREQYTPPVCPGSYNSPPEPIYIAPPERPDLGELETEIDSIRKASGRGELDPIQLNVEPPILVAAHHITPPLLPTVTGTSSRQSEIDAKAAPILAAAQGKSDFEKALIIHDALAVVPYDQSGTGQDSSNLYGVLVAGQATCNGYAEGFKWLAERAGLECTILTGRSNRGVPHAWNAVRLNNVWHYVDVTWDRPLSPDDGIYHDYFLMTAEEMLKERILSDDTADEFNETLSGFADYYQRMGYSLRGSPGDDAMSVMSEMFYRQLRTKELPLSARAVFLEVKVSGNADDYTLWKERFLKDIFGIQREIAERAKSDGASFKIDDMMTAKCDFNDTTQVLTFYPVVIRTD